MGAAGEADDAFGAALADGPNLRLLRYPQPELSPQSRHV
jgi:hypothetical protein